MSERNFYELSRITEVDVFFLNAFIQSTGASLKESHRTLIASLAHIAKVSDLIHSSDRATTNEKRIAQIAQTAVIETEEKLQGQIEQDALPLLKQLREKQSAFVNTYETAMTFFRFLAHQYFRTKQIREAIGEDLLQISPDHDLAHLRHVVGQIVAENVGASLFVDRNEFGIIFWETKSDTGFITGDQPIVNLLGTGDSRQTTELVFYYPLSPTLSCVVAPKALGLQSAEIPFASVEILNGLMAWKAEDFLVAKTNEVLQRTLSKPLLVRPSGERILESIVS